MHSFASPVDYCVMFNKMKEMNVVILCVELFISGTWLSLHAAFTGRGGGGGGEGGGIRRQ